MNPFNRILLVLSWLAVIVLSPKNDILLDSIPYMHTLAEIAERKRDGLTASIIGYVFIGTSTNKAILAQKIRVQN